MPRKFAFEVEINQWRVIQLPMDVPIGKALVLVVIPGSPDAEDPDPPAPSPGIGEGDPNKAVTG